MSNSIETVFQKLLTPDNDSLKQGTNQLMDYFISDKCVLGFFNVIKTSQSPQIRIYASTLLRKKLKSWKRISDREKVILKEEILEILVQEPDELVRKQIMWLAATIYKYSFQSGHNWPQLLALINELVLSSDEGKHLQGMIFLDLLIEESADEIKLYFMDLIPVLMKIFSEASNLKSVFYAMSCLNHMIPFINELEALTDLFQLVMDDSVKLLKNYQTDDTVSIIFDMFQSLIEYEVPFVLTRIHDFIQTVLAIIKDSTLLKSTRITFMSFLNVLIETQKSALIRTQLLFPVTESILSIMLDSNDQLQIKSKIESDLLEGEKLEDWDLDEDDNLFSSACQVLDYCALYFPANKLAPMVIEFASRNLYSESSCHRRAGLAAVATTCEGCASFYKSNYIEILAEACLRGMQDFDQSVVQVAYFALSQFSEFLQPNITRYSDKFMKLFIESIETRLQLRTISRLTLRFYGALQSFCENMGNELEIYLPTLMSKLMTMELLCSSSLKIKRLILTTFSSILSSVKSNFDQYFDYVIQLIKPHIHLEFESLESESKFLQIECVELMASLAKWVSRHKFSPILCENSLFLVHNTLTNETDPEMRAAVYHLFAALAVKLKHQLPLKTVLPQILETLRSEDGLNIVESGNKPSDLFSQFDEIDLDDEDDLNDSKLDSSCADDNERENSFCVLNEESKHVVVDNEYVGEKLAAIYCIQEVCKHRNTELIEFYDQCFGELKRLLDFVNVNVRKDSFLALAHLVSYNYEFEVAQNLNDFHEFYRKAVKSIELDLNRELIMSVFNSLKVLLTRLSSFIRKQPGQFSPQLDRIGNLIIDTFNNKIYCQTINKIEQEFDQAEYDFVLKEYAGDVVPSLALCLDPDHTNGFVSKVVDYFANLITGPSSTSNEKSFSIGLLGEMVDSLGSIDASSCHRIFTDSYGYILSNEDALRSNTIFAIGVICSCSNNFLSSLYPKIVSDILNLTQMEQNKQTMDNICGALARLFVCSMSANIEDINYEHLIGKIFELTPLRVDLCEYQAIFTLVLKTDYKLLLDHYPRIIDLCGLVLATDDDDLKPKTKELVVSFIRWINGNFKRDLDQLLSRSTCKGVELIREYID